MGGVVQFILFVKFIWCMGIYNIQIYSGFIVKMNQKKKIISVSHGLLSSCDSKIALEDWFQHLAGRVIAFWDATKVSIMCLCVFAVSLVYWTENTLDRKYISNLEMLPWIVILARYIYILDIKWIYSVLGLLLKQF